MPGAFINVSVLHSKRHGKILLFCTYYAHFYQEKSWHSSGLRAKL